MDQRNQPETGDDQQRDLQAVPPEPFSGVSSQCKGFIFQCKLFFQLKSISFSNDFSKIHFMLGLLQGKALTWAEARFAGRTFSGLTFSAFLEEFRRVFESPATPFCASSRLFTITQDSARSVADYTLEFRTLAAEVDWTEDAPALCAAFYNGLRELAWDVSAVPLQFPPEIPNSPGDRLQILQVRLLNLRVFRPLRNPCMQVGGAHLSREERNRWLRAGECVFTVGELVTPCLPVPNRRPKGPGPPPPSASSFNGSPFRLSFDSGAEENFIDEQAAEQAGIPSEPLERPRNALAVDGRILAQVTHRTLPVKLVLSGNHVESIQLLVISSPATPLIIGLLVSPTGEAPTPHSPLIEPVDLSGVPPAYHDLQEVFNKDKALSLPPHRPYDCAIELLPDAPLPFQPPV
ncbi:hypothetical protein L3Q82_000666 [Scortum barcoo]|uniref:Uncharacterized protein n=1 Tax=Scortum barcoo TaxID=214431 RepID=A0ACB8WF25_9TELE|nr:hypothetical protein L3Q82_000666 [Scortum barcoo]